MRLRPDRESARVWSSIRSGSAGRGSPDRFALGRRELAGVDGRPVDSGSVDLWSLAAGGWGLMVARQVVRLAGRRLSLRAVRVWESAVGPTDQRELLRPRRWDLVHQW